MTKKIKSLSVLAVAVIAGLLVSLTSVDVMANQLLDNSNESIVTVLEGSLVSVMVSSEIELDNKCGEGKCGTATKEAKEKGDKKAVTEKKDGKVTTEKKCGEGKCGAGEKKEAKAEKEGAKKEAKEGKCGEGKCGVA